MAVSPSDPVPNFTAETPAEIQARLAAIVESSDDAIVSKTLDGVIRTWNKGAERIFGYTSDEVVGKPITIIIPPDRLSEETTILTRIRAGQRIDHFETIRLTKDGRELNVSVTVSPVRDDTGRIVGASKIARDITDQRRIQRELQAAKEAAESANRAKDHFLSVLSHELRTPLTPALAAVSYIEGQCHRLPEEIRGHVGMVRRNIETQARLVDDLLDVTRISRGKVHLHMEAVDINAALRGVVGMLQAEIESKELAVTIALRAKDHHTWADAGRLQQVFLNLLSNAVKFTPEGGSILIRTARADEGRIRVEMRDTGVGIEPAALPRLFDPFEQGGQTVAREFGGLGLGLSIVKSLVELHGGTVSAASEGRGKGATFAVELQTVAAPAPESAPAPAQSPAANGLHILLVEDHADTREIMSRLLSGFGFAVTTAGSVREALELGERLRFDLLVSDLGLPDGSGNDVMRRLREHHQIKGIALSGFGQDEDLRLSREAGFDRHLIKPVNLQTLREVILKLSD